MFKKKNAPGGAEARRNLQPEEARREFILRRCAAHTRGLEISPYFNPVVDKRKYDVFYVDCIPNEEIRKKAFSNPGFLGRSLPKVDAVWTPGKKLSECVGGRRFGYAVACHVLEHVPNPLGWWEEILECLEGGGRLALVLPIKSRTMDYYRPLTTFAQVAGWYIEKPLRPTPVQVMDFLSQSFEDKGELDFDKPMPPFKEARRCYSDEKALEFARFVNQTDHYLDVHCTVWTPTSFTTILRRLRKAKLLAAGISGPFVGFPGSTRAEFLVYLEKPGLS